MEYRLGTGKRIKEYSDTVELVCPSCNEKVNFGVFANMERRIQAKLPLPVDCHNVYFLVCPKCASIFTVDETRGDEFKKGSKMSIGNFDLKTLKPFKETPSDE